MIATMIASITAPEMIMVRPSVRSRSRPLASVTMPIMMIATDRDKKAIDRIHR